MKKFQDFTETELVQLAEELKDRTVDLVQEELYILLEENGFVNGEFDDNECDLLNAVSDRFYNPIMQYLNAKILEEIKKNTKQLDK